MSYRNTLDDYLLLDRQSQPLSLQVELVAKEQNLYQQGRKLVNQMYAKKWGAKSLIDDNDYGVVVSCCGKVVGNVNLQIKPHKNHLLHSEIFYAEKHWENYLNIADNQIGEISGLSISDSIPQFLSRPVMMGIVLGVHLMYNSLQIRYLTTIQHEYLIRILQKSFNLPFFCNEIITVPQGEVPDDNYWKRDKMPRIYYLDGYSDEVIKACASLFCYLSIAGYHTQFIAEKPVADINYSSFWRVWNSSSNITLAA